MTKKLLILLLLCVSNALHAANYLTFTAEADNSSFGIHSEGDNKPDVQYSLDGGKTWTRLTNDTLIPLPNKKKALLRGYNPQGISRDFDEITRFVMTGRIAASGSVMSLIDGKGESLVIPGEKCFRNLFEGCRSLTQAPQLPATKLEKECYKAMFAGTSLTRAPKLPATTLAKECYKAMFDWCTNLTQAPQLPSTQLADRCYELMFNGCTSLTRAPKLPAITLDTSCYSLMFCGCTSLTNAPELPATKLALDCYGAMFLGCSNLKRAPKLPATQLAEGCYQIMFRECTSLRQAPALPATTLTIYCYYSMFEGCTSLTQAPELPATSLVQSCYVTMFKGCSNLTEIKVGFIDWNRDGTYCSDTFFWLFEVAPNGKFICPKELPKKSGESKIPEGWTIIEN